MKRRFLFLILLFLIQRDVSPILKQKATITMEQVMINTKKYGDCGNRSFIPFTARLHGSTVWPRDTMEMGKTCRGTPLQLMVWNNLLIVDCGTELIALDKTTGTSQWNRSKFDISEFDASDKGIVTINQAGKYETLNIKGVIVESIPLPAFFDQSRLLFSVKSGEDMYYLLNYFGSKFVSATSNPAPVNFTFEHMKIKNQASVWSYVQRQEIAKWACGTADGAMLHIASGNALTSFPVDAEQDKQVRRTLFACIEAISLNHDDRLLIVEKKDKGRFLTITDKNHECKASHAVELEGDILQPVASSPDGTLFMAAGTTLMCISKGVTAWQYRFEYAIKPILFTVLADKSVLAISGHTIYQLSPQGEKVFETFVIPEITCRPVTDADGRVYIGGNGGIVCLQ